MWRNMHTSLFFPFPSLFDIADQPVAPGSGDTVGVFSLLSLMISVNPSGLM